jgi:ABC-type nitrate/sulfonate/bicarbonate transport system substrate-binding protein
VAALNGLEHVFLSSIAAYIGLDPKRDITWVVHSPDKLIELFKEGKIDVMLGFPPTPQRLRDERIGRVLVNSAIDRPWSEYFCCLVTASREFVRRNPIATKAAVRAILKATAESAHLLADRKVDALMAFPPVPQELRANNIGHVIVNSGVDRPWSQYFCCMLATNREFVRQYPIATKRALRAILKATDICALEPERAAQIIVDGGAPRRTTVMLVRP